MIIESVTVGSMEVNCYILAEGAGQDAIIIDPGAQAHKIEAALKKHNLRPAIVLNTHGHYDHIGADDKFGVEVMIHKDDADFLANPMLNLSGVFSVPYKYTAKAKTLEDGQVIERGAITLETLHIPGHTPGGAAFLLKSPQKNVVFTGDTLFSHGVGRSDLEGGNEELLMRRIKEKLLSLPDDTVVYPGHGPSTTIGEERKYNPFLRD